MSEGAVAAIVAVVGAGASVYNTDQQRKQARVARDKANFEEAKSRRRVIAEQRMLQAQTAAQAEAQGITGSSSVMGAQASLSQQAADTINFQQQIASFQSQMNKYQHRINNAATLGDVASAGIPIAQYISKKPKKPKE